jgi:hypothetical protein
MAPGSAKKPAAHGWHVAFPWREVLPDGHASHAEAPALGWWKPAWHVKHDRSAMLTASTLGVTAAIAVKGWYVCGGHVRHEVRSSDE